MKPVTMLASSLALLSMVITVNGETKRERAPTPQIIWGKVTRGLQLGISRPAGAVRDTDTVSVHVHLRNVSKSPVRLLASVHGCVAMGPHAAMLVSKLTLEPHAGGDPLTVTYRGWNHLHLLDRRRPKSESWQQTLCKNIRKDGQIQLRAEDAQYLTTVLAPGKTEPVERVVFGWGKESGSRWCVANASKALPAGKYKVTAVFTVDQRLSEWKGELSSGPLQVSIAQRDGAQAEDKKSEESTNRPAPAEKTGQLLKKLGADTFSTREKK